MGKAGEREREPWRGGVLRRRQEWTQRKPTGGGGDALHCRDRLVRHLDSVKTRQVVPNNMLFLNEVLDFSTQKYKTPCQVFDPIIKTMPEH